MLEDKVCFITGGAQGIGLGIARACAERGAKIAIADINAAALEQARAELEPIADVRTYELDVSDRDAAQRVADQVKAELGPVYALFNNAGIADSVSPSKMRGEMWDWMLAVNLNGVYNCIQAFLPTMLEQGDGGFITNTSSVAGLVAGGSGFAYHASKFAVVGLSESLRLELAPRGISVSVVCPGNVATSIVMNTRGLRPEDAEQPTPRATQILDGYHQVLLEQGVPADDAGRTIVNGTLAGLGWIFTDATLGDAIALRTQEVLSSMSRCFTPEENDVHRSHA